MRGLLVSCIGMLLLLCGGVPGYAQGPGDPIGGMFGAPAQMQNGSQSLTANGNLGVSFFDVLERGSIPAGVTVGPSRGWGTVSSAGLAYRLTFAGVHVSGSGSVYTAHYPALNRPVRLHYRGNGHTGISRSFDLSSRTRVGLATTIAYRPSYLSSIVPGGLGQIGDELDASLFLDPDAVLTRGHDIAWGSGVSLRHELTRRLSFGAGYDYRQDWRIGGNFGRPSLSAHSAYMRVTAQLTRSLSVYGGYRYAETHYRATATTFRTQMADIGADYGRGLTVRLSRNTTLGFGGGVAGYADHLGRQRFHLTGNVVLDHTRRLWTSSLQYSRGVDAADIFFQTPILYDRVSARLSGLVGSRLRVHALTFFRRSTVGFLGGDNRALQGAAMAGVQTALTQYLACTVNYTYFRNEFGSQAAIPGGVTSQYASQSVRALLNVWAPLLNRARRANASR